MNANNLGKPEHACIFIGDTLKMVRETLCVAQMTIGRHDASPRCDEHIDRIQRLIEDIDRQRPLGSDGKHGNQHTAFCGCAGAEHHALPRPPCAAPAGP